jgi:hypothetical protein
LLNIYRKNLNVILGDVHTQWDGLNIMYNLHGNSIEF